MTFIPNIQGSRITGSLTGITSISATTYYNLPSSSFTGGTVTGATNFTGGLTANTISATTYFGLPTDIRVTGGTFSSGTAIFRNNTGGTFSVSGFSTGGSTEFTGGTVNGETNFTSGLSANTISATTYFGLPTDIHVTGGTYSSGTTTFTNNIDGTFNVTGYPTKTSDLFNDGDDGISNFISLEDLPSSLVLYATSSASDIGGYSKIVTTISDPSYDSVAVDINTGSITTTNQLIASLATSDNIIVGNPGILNVTTIGNIRRTSGTGTAEFYFEVYKRTSGGTETLITTSSYTIPIESPIYSQLNTTALWNDGVFLDTDRIVLKFYGTRIGGGSDPTYDFQFGGSNPVRTTVPIPLNVVPSQYIFTGGTVTGPTNFLSGLTSTTISATTYYNLPVTTDIRVTGGTYSNGTTTFRNNTGGTFTVTGLSTGTTASNVGSGVGIFSGKTGDDLQFKTITSTGATVTITSDATTVNIESAGGGGSGVSDANKVFSWFMNIT